MDEFAKKCGFESEIEMIRLVCEVDLTSPIKVGRFQQWKDSDGAKDGLLKIIEENNRGE